MDIAKGIFGIAKEVVSAARSRKAGRSDRLVELIKREGRRRGLEGEPPEYVVKHARILIEEGVEPERAIEEAVDWWEETEAYRRALD